MICIKHPSVAKFISSCGECSIVGCTHTSMRGCVCVDGGGRGKGTPPGGVGWPSEHGYYCFQSGN